MTRQLSVRGTSRLQRRASLLAVRALLQLLCQPRLVRGLSRDLRGEVRAVLRHLPSQAELEQMLAALEALEAAATAENQ